MSRDWMHYSHCDVCDFDCCYVCSVARMDDTALKDDGSVMVSPRLGSAASRSGSIGDSLPTSPRDQPSITVTPATWVAPLTGS